MVDRKLTLGTFKQARTATAVNKQLHFRVKKKPLTTSTYCIFEAYFMIQSL